MISITLRTKINSNLSSIKVLLCLFFSISNYHHCFYFIEFLFVTHNYAYLQTVICYLRQQRFKFFKHIIYGQSPKLMLKIWLFFFISLNHFTPSFF